MKRLSVCSLGKSWSFKRHFFPSFFPFSNKSPYSWCLNHYSYLKMLCLGPKCLNKLSFFQGSIGARGNWAVCVTQPTSPLELAVNKASGSLLMPTLFFLFLASQGNNWTSQDSWACLYPCFPLEDTKAQVDQAILGLLSRKPATRLGKDQEPRNIDALKEFYNLRKIGLNTFVKLCAFYL